MGSHRGRVHALDGCRTRLILFTPQTKANVGLFVLRFRRDKRWLLACEKGMDRLTALYKLSVAYQGCRDRDAVLKALASHLAADLGARAVFIWLITEDGSALRCRTRWVEPGERFDVTSEPVAEGILAENLSAAGALRVSRSQIDDAGFAHLSANTREQVQNALYAALRDSAGAAGVVEVLNKRGGDFTAEEATLLEEAVELTHRALNQAEAIEKDRSDSLATIERLTSLYDISRIFNSTLELEELLPIVAGKIREILGAQACNIWLLDPENDDLYFAQQVGKDPTTQVDSRTAIGQGLLGEVARQGEPRLVEDAAAEPLLAERLQSAPDFALESVLCAPLTKGEQVLGVVEAVNKLAGGPFDEDDLFLLASVTDQAAIALYNANLLAAERKVGELDALLAISKEITSTLDLERVLTTVVHQAATVLPFDRCVIGLLDRSTVVLGAVSGEATVPQTAEMDQLRRVLAPIVGGTDPVSADHFEDGWVTSPEKGFESLVNYLEEHGYNGFYAVPLRDEQGAVGVIALLSGDGQFLPSEKLEILGILAGQTTVAIRNARLYQQVPLRNVWQPLIERKQKLLSMPHSRWLEFAGKVALVCLALVIIPWKLRIGTMATVVPAERRIVSAAVNGVILKVLVHEGSRVHAGDTLAVLDDSANRLKLDNAETNLALARRELDRTQASGDLAGAGQARLKMQIDGDEVSLYQQKVAEAQLKAPISGVVVTPHVEEKAGQLLKPGSAFCQLVDEDRMAVTMNVSENDIALIRAPATAAIKLNSFPTQTLEGRVVRVGSQSVTAGGNPYFVVRALFANPNDEAREGMVGRAKITAAGGWIFKGWYPVGYVLLRAPARWFWRKIWRWMP